MASLPPYTNTYHDVNASIMDATDLVDEFWRVSEFMTLWNGSIEAIGQEDHFEEYLEIITGELAEVLPARGLIQRLEIAASVETFEVKINEHTTGAPFRIHIIIRCRSKDTRFTLSVPSGQSHIFGVNRAEYMPSQVIGDGFYTAALVCSYGADQGVMVQVMAANPEEELVDYNDVLTAVSK